MLNLLQNKYFKNTYWLLLEKVIRLGLTIITVSLVARYLGPTELGKYNYVQTFIAIFVAFVTLGIDALIVQELLEKPDERNQLLGSIFTLRFIFSILAIFLIFTILFFAEYDSDVRFGITLLSIAIVLQNFTIIEVYFQAMVNSKLAAISNFISLIVGTALKLTLIFLKSELRIFFYVLLVESLIQFGGYIYFYTKSGQNILLWKLNLKKLKDIFRKSWPFIISSLSIVIYMKIDQIMIEQILDYKSVGFYSAALKLSETWFFVPLAISASFYPSLVHTKRDGGNYLERFQLLYDGILILGLGLAVSTTILSPYLIEFLYGPKFAPSSSVLSLQIWATFLIFLGVANNKWYVLFGKQKILMKITIISCSLNIISNYFFIKMFGIKGAAITTIISSSFSTFFGMFLFYKEMKPNIILSLNAFNIFKSIPNLLKRFRSNERFR